MTTKLRASEQERNKQMRVFMQTGQTGVAAAGATPLDQYSKTGAAEGEEAAEEEEKPLDFDEVMACVKNRLRHAIEQVSMAWRSTRRFRTNAP